MLATIRVGEGSRPVVLLHGFLGSGRNLSSFARRWAQADPSRWFLLPDLTGHGISPPLQPDADLRTIANDVIETARANGIHGPLSIAGHSFGGRVALVATELVEVSDVTLLDIGPGPIPTSTSESFTVLELLLQAPPSAPDRETMRRFFLDRGLSPALTEWILMNLVHTDDGYVWRIDAIALGALHRRVNHLDLWNLVEKPHARLRAVRGGNSRYVTEGDKARLEAAGCPVATIEGAGHFVHVDKPLELVELLTGARAPV